MDRTSSHSEFTSTKGAFKDVKQNGVVINQKYRSSERINEIKLKTNLKSSKKALPMQMQSYVSTPNLLVNPLAQQIQTDTSQKDSNLSTKRRNSHEISSEKNLLNFISPPTSHLSASMYAGSVNTHLSSSKYFHSQYIGECLNSITEDETKSMENLTSCNELSRTSSSINLNSSYNNSEKSENGKTPSPKKESIIQKEDNNKMTSSCIVSEKKSSRKFGLFKKWLSFSSLTRSLSNNSISKASKNSDDSLLLSGNLKEQKLKVQRKNFDSLMHIAQTTNDDCINEDFANDKMKKANKSKYSQKYLSTYSLTTTPSQMNYSSKPLNETKKSGDRKKNELNKNLSERSVSLNTVSSHATSFRQEVFVFFTITFLN